MNDYTPTRSLLIALGDERRTMREGSAFLDEKCLLLAGEMLREVRRHRALLRELHAADSLARAALRSAVARHGVNGLQVAAPGRFTGRVEVRHRSLLGVGLVEAAVSGPSPAAVEAVNPSPEATACSAAHGRLLPLLVELAATSTNLARLHAEYRRTVRRVRALQDVLLPELDSAIGDIDTRLEDLEREDALAVRWRA
jgi:V/A-type H+-transporting ATPase subunit D